MDLFADRKFLRIAHRGASAYEPENTLRSFRRAIELGADMVELDVRKSLDGRLVIIHDSSVDRTTNGKGPVRMKSLDELKTLDAGMGERVPTLEEVVECGAGRTRFVIELKEDRLEERVVGIIKEFGVTDDVFVVSFKPVRLRAIKDIEPRLKTGLILFASSDPLRAAAMCGADAVAPFRWFITRGLAERARAAGMYLFTWTVDEKERAERLKELGVSGIVTNRPDLI
ncbi:MAG TPA: glycerophosphodiester phosphodiesterase family protein [Thermodesulfobacteriota bacterium]|nr:glycerophosphodiester phosphodiesterase family protein [Thermodesulfobacteriota bacterium]